MLAEQMFQTAVRRFDDITYVLLIITAHPGTRVETLGCAVMFAPKHVRSRDVWF